MLNEMMRNGSGYVDMTAYNGMTNANPGEIWTMLDKDDEYYLIIAISGKVCTALKLTIRECDGSVPVNCHGPMYTNPAMMCYIFTNKLGGYVKTVPKAEFKTVRMAAANVLGFAMTDGTTEIKPNEEWVPKAECDNLKKQLEETQVDLCVQKDTNGMLSESITDMELELASCKPYKLMYLELLDKLIAKVGAAL